MTVCIWLNYIIVYTIAIANSVDFSVIMCLS